MILDVLIYGAALFWALTVIPAGIACCVRQQWMYFWFGWLTLGILWYIGALARKSGQSAYGTRQVGIALAVPAAAFLALGFFGARPSAVLGVDGDSLQNSVGDTLVFYAGSSCKRSGELWRCSRWTGGDSTGVPYRVKVNGLGCWEAVSEVDSVDERNPKKVSGCVTLYDFLLD